MKPETILVQAVSGEARSVPFLMKVSKELPPFEVQFVLEVKPAANNKFRVSNKDLGLDNTHMRTFLTPRIDGFRRTQNGVTYLVAEIATEKQTLPSLTDLTNLETF